MAEKVLGIGGVILSAEEYVLGTDLPGFDAGPNLPQQLGRALDRVIQREAGLSELSQAIADQGRVLRFGIVQRHA
jgi:hypothetical protein